MKELIKKLIETYSSGDYDSDFKLALEQYIDLAGKAINDSSEYEAYMQRFQAWFAFQWRDQQQIRLVDRFIKSNHLEYSEEEALINMNYSFFEVLSQTKEHWIIYDILHHKKLYIDDLSLVLMPEDLFIGRTVSSDRDFLVEGVCLVPKNLLPLIKKQCKTVRSQMSLVKEHSYLLKLESLCLRANMYRNLNHESLFDFPVV